MLGKCFTTELHIQPYFSFLKDNFARFILGSQDFSYSTSHIPSHSLLKQGYAEKSPHSLIRVPLYVMSPFFFCFKNSMSLTFDNFFYNVSQSSLCWIDSLWGTLSFMNSDVSFQKDHVKMYTDRITPLFKTCGGPIYVSDQ